MYGAKEEDIQAEEEQEQRETDALEHEIEEQERAVEEFDPELPEEFRDEVVEPEDGNKEYVKKVEPALRDWVLCETCRRVIANAYFANPLKEKGERDASTTRSKCHSSNAINLRSLPALLRQLRHGQARK